MLYHISILTSSILALFECFVKILEEKCLKILSYFCQSLLFLQAANITRKIEISKQWCRRSYWLLYFSWVHGFIRMYYLLFELKKTKVINSIFVQCCLSSKKKFSSLPRSWYLPLPSKFSQHHDCRDEIIDWEFNYYEKRAIIKYLKSTRESFSETCDYRFWRCQYNATNR